MYIKRCADCVPHVDCAVKYIKTDFRLENTRAEVLQRSGAADDFCAFSLPAELQTERMISRMSEKNPVKAPEGNVPLYLFRSGKNSHAYEYMGVHNTVRNGKACAVCRVWAPNAKAVSITGDFCGWDTDRYPLTKIDDAVWEGYTDEPFEAYAVYKLAITDAKSEAKRS